MKKVIIAAFLALILIFTVSVSSTKAVGALVQEATALNDSGVGATTIVRAFTSNITAGNMIIGAVGYGDVSTTVSVADTLGNTYTVSTVNADGGNLQYQRTFYANSSTGGANTVTVTFGTSVAYRRLYISEYSGLATASPNDGGTGQLQTSPGTGTDAITSGNIVTTVDGDLIWGITQNTSEVDPGTGTLVAGTGYTQDAQVGTVIMRAEHKTQTTAGSVAATFTASIDHRLLTNILAFKVASGAAVANVPTVSIQGQVNVSGSVKI